MQKKQILSFCCSYCNTPFQFLFMPSWNICFIWRWTFLWHLIPISRQSSRRPPRRSPFQMNANLQIGNRIKQVRIHDRFSRERWAGALMEVRSLSALNLLYFLLFVLVGTEPRRMDPRRTDGRTDKAAYRVACSRLKTSYHPTINLDWIPHFSI